MKRLVVLVVLLAGCGYAGNRGYDWYTSQINQPMSSSSQKIAFHINQGESSDLIASDLAAKGLIRSPEVFLFYLRYQDKGAQLQAGDFTLDRNMSMLQIIDALGQAKVVQLSVTLTPGQTLKQMAQSATTAGLGTADSYVAAAGDMTWPYDFLQGRPQGAPANLEGFLFPDTYQLDKGATARDLVKRQLDQFGQQVTPAMRAQLAQAAPGRPVESLYNVVTLASIVEREVTKDPDRAIVCGIFYNRLAIHMALQDDITVLYGLNKPAPLTDVDKQKDTPYNTYLHPGLPAGPISNPGLASINACVTPQKTNYLFFFADANKITRYATTYAEHLRQQQQYGLAPD
ncbi:MAG: endolytic transglycosylase MltG [Chloroflexi bacterium]|nr:MAG: endolytic transglycosylase MltG [Chloroflexota bacterium]